MKKTIKLNLIVLAVILIFYSVTITVSFSNIKENVEAEYRTEVSNLDFNIYQAGTLTYDSDSEDYREWSCVEEFLNDYEYNISYPHRVVVYDSNGSEVARTSTMIEFSSDSYRNENITPYVKYFCNLDNYLTEEQKDFIVQHNKYGGYIKQFACISEGKDNLLVTPVYLEYVDVKENKEYRINFTDETPNVIVDYNFRLNVIDDRNKHYEFIDKQIEDGIPQSYLDENNDDMGGIGLASYSRCNELYIGSEVYSVLSVSYIDSGSYTLHDFRFTNSLNNITLLYVTVTAIVLAVLNVYIKRNRLNKAKYVFTNAAAHELKTPLAVIENKCEFILEGVDESKTLEYVNQTYKEALKMNSLLNNLLRYNKLATQSRIEKSRNNLTLLIKNEIEKYSSAAKVKNIAFDVDLIEADINCNAELISLAIGNFLSNAVKFSPSDSTVAITLTKCKTKYKLSVVNAFDGAINEKVWDMLYMTDEARGGKSTGMGLPTSKEILELHNYKYGFKNENGTVEFYFIAK
ncbi:MAG: HAMP domain-containing histidine kinase [Eubacterium sp.]|nr:HAMP domain-containing histidine kinase [Eubacterium sp.]